MPNFILEIILLLSFGLMVYLVARAAPRISDVLDEQKTPRAGLGKKFYNLIESLPLQKIDLAFTKFLEKILRRARVLVIKLDNQLVGHLERFKLMRKNSVEQQGKEFSLFKENPLEDDLTDPDLKDESQALSDNLEK